MMENRERASSIGYLPSLFVAGGVLLGSWLIAELDTPLSIKVVWPAIAALATILVFKQAVLGLFLGALAGCTILVGGNLFTAIKELTSEHFFPSMQGPWRVGAILFTLVLGAFAVVIERGGGFTTLAHKFLGHGDANNARRVEASTGAMGLVCFFDGLANSLLLGKIMRPLADHTGVSRAKLAYLVDSTSSSIACIAFISTWIATQLSLIQQSIEGHSVIQDSAYSLFIRSIPQNYYCVFTLILVALVIWRRWDIGPMRKATPVKTEAEQTTNSHISIWVALTPIIVLTLSILCLFYVWETDPIFPITTDKLTSAFGGSAGPYAMTLGSIIGLTIACLMFPKSKKPQVSDAVRDGASSMLSPLLILVMAWTFGSVMKELGTAKWLADAIGSKFSPNYFPAAIFITGALISFFTGSSWGTMALMMPLALPAYLDIAGQQPELITAVIAAVFSGAVFGDHCSPFSDTTIVSAFACGVSAQEHVITQLPYALLAAITALVIGFIGLGSGLSAWLTLLLGALFLFMLCYLSTRKASNPSEHQTE